MRNVSKIFVQLGFSDSQLASVRLNADSYESQEGQAEHVQRCTKVTVVVGR